LFGSAARCMTSASLLIDFTVAGSIRGSVPGWWRSVSAVSGLYPSSAAGMPDGVRTAPSVTSSSVNDSAGATVAARADGAFLAVAFLAVAFLADVFLAGAFLAAGSTNVAAGAALVSGAPCVASGVSAGSVVDHTSELSPRTCPAARSMMRIVALAPAAATPMVWPVTEVAVRTGWMIALVALLMRFTALPHDVVSGNRGTRARILHTVLRHYAGEVHRIFTTSFASVYPLYVTKVEKKGRTNQELDQVIRWLTGYDEGSLSRHLAEGTTFEEFFADAKLNPNASLITGSVCGVRVEEVDDPLMQKIRYLDKLVDELARGRPMAKVLRA
jgi:hypothetical protein